MRRRLHRMKTKASYRQRACRKMNRAEDRVLQGAPVGGQKPHKIPIGTKSRRKKAKISAAHTRPKRKLRRGCARWNSSSTKGTNRDYLSNNNDIDRAMIARTASQR